MGDHGPDLTADDPRKIFISRVPRRWDSEALRACLEREMGTAGGAEVVEQAD